MPVGVGGGLEFQPQNRVALLRRHNFNDAVGHLFKEAVVAGLLFDMNNVELPELIAITIEKMPHDTMFVSMQSIDTLSFDDVRVAAIFAAVAKLLSMVIPLE